jgi:hypothetical protein
MIPIFIATIGVVVMQIHFLRENIPGFLLFIIVAITVTVGTFSSRKFSVIETRWTIDEKGFTVNWLPKYKFQKNDDVYSEWTNVKKYRDISGKGYSIFVVDLTNGETLRFPYGGLLLFDDSLKLQEAFHVFYLNAVHPERMPLGYRLKKDFGL